MTNKIISHFKLTIEKNSQQQIENYFNEFKKKRILIYGNKEHFDYFSTHVYDLNQLNIVTFKDSFSAFNKESDTKNIDIILLVVLSTVYERVIYDTIHNFVNTKTLVKELLLDLALSYNLKTPYNNQITHERFLGELNTDKTSLWNNISNLEKRMSQNQILSILNKDIKSYPELLEYCLKTLNYINKNNVALGYGSRMDYFLEIGKCLDNFLVFYGQQNNLPDKPNYLFGHKYISFFSFIEYFIQTDEHATSAKTKQIHIEHAGIPAPYNRLKKTRPYEQNTLYLFGSMLLKGDLTIGYPRLDNFIKYYSENQKETENISIITTGYNHISKQFAATFIDNGYIEYILKEFQNNTVILRPHIYWREYSNMLAYKNTLSKYKNFEYDENDSYLEHLSSNKVFISEGLGSTVYTYAMSTLKPVIFYMPNEEIYQKHFGYTYFAKYRSIIGDIAYNRKELKLLINKHLKDIPYYQYKQNEIKKLRAKVFRNIGNSKNKTAYFIKKYINLEQNSKLKSFYQEKLENQANEDINNYFENINKKRIGVFGVGFHHDISFNKIYNTSNLNIISYADLDEEFVGQTIDDIPIISKSDFKDIDLILNLNKAYSEIAYEELKKLYPKIMILNVFDDIGLNIILAQKFYSKDTWVDNRVFENEFLWINILKLERKMKNIQIEEIKNKKCSTYLELFFNCIKSIYNTDTVQITNDISELVNFKNNCFFGEFYIKHNNIIR